MTAVVLAVTHHVRLPGFEVGVRTQTGVDAYAVEKVWLALLAALTEITPSKSLLPAPRYTPKSEAAPPLPVPVPAPPVAPRKTKEPAAPPVTLVPPLEVPPAPAYSVMELPAPAVVPVPLLAPPALQLTRSPSAAFSPLAASTGGDCGLAVKPLEKLQVSCEASLEEPVLLYWL